ncbi:Uncharacterised protein [Shigella dysenteriae]|uniref:Uncharacterized protein n=1 Tax=Shigella dysenteriae TaxID=622 RepID=A0A2X2K422_SHIDY|nr:Uncharacterised protein [Shigella dysenteriae]
MTFSWISTEREKQIVLRAKRLMRVRSVRLLRSIRLGEYFSGQMLILRHLPAIAAPVVAGDHADVEWRKQCQ